MQMWKPALKKRLYPYSEFCDTGEIIQDQKFPM